jgi:hypothetical protein
LAVTSDGTAVGWGEVWGVETDVPPALNEVVGIAGGLGYNLFLGANLPPNADAQTVDAAPNQSLTISLSGYDLNGDLLSFRITGLPNQGALYEYDSGSRGALIATNDTWLTDPAGNVIFVPATNSCGAPYSSFQFVANDGLVDSQPGTVTINVLAAPVVISTYGLAQTPTPSFQVSFGAFSNQTYSAWASTNLLDWQRLGTASEIVPGNYLFADPTTNFPMRFYQIRWP